MQRPNSILKDYKKLARLFSKGSVFTAVDTETTGLDPGQNRIIEIGAVQFSRHGIIASYSQLINPGCRIPSGVMAVNNITDDMVAAQPLISEVLPSFLSFIGTSILIAHNVCFDLDFLQAEIRRCSLPAFTNKAADTVLLARDAYSAAPNHKLQTLAQYLHIPVHTAHRAHDDARVCMEIFIKCMEKLGAPPGPVAETGQLSLLL